MQLGRHLEPMNKQVGGYTLSKAHFQLISKDTMKDVGFLSPNREGI